jgi:cell division protein FtsX
VKPFIAVAGQSLWRLAGMLGWLAKASVAAMFLYAVYTVVFKSVSHGILLMGTSIAYLWIMSGIVVLLGLVAEWLRESAATRADGAIAHLIPPQLGEFAKH